jgi:hypothetical protein
MGWMPHPTASKSATLVMLRYQAKEKASISSICASLTPAF